MCFNFRSSAATLDALETQVSFFPRRRVWASIAALVPFFLSEVLRSKSYLSFRFLPILIPPSVENIFNWMFFLSPPVFSFLFFYFESTIYASIHYTPILCPPPGPLQLLTTSPSRPTPPHLNFLCDVFFIRLLGIFPIHATAPCVLFPPAISCPWYCISQCPVFGGLNQAGVLLFFLPSPQYLTCTGDIADTSFPYYFSGFFGFSFFVLFLPLLLLDLTPSTIHTLPAV